MFVMAPMVVGVLLHKNSLWTLTLLLLNGRGDDMLFANVEMSVMAPIQSVNNSYTRQVCRL